VQNPLDFQGLLEAAPDAMVGTDQAGVIRFVNRQTELLFDYDRTDLVGQPIRATRRTTPIPTSGPKGRDTVQRTIPSN